MLFNVLAHEILPIDAIESVSAVFIISRIQNIFEENKQGFGGKSHALTHFIAFEEHMADKTVWKYLADGRNM